MRIDTNKGDDENPEIRSRLVAKEFNDGEGEGLFAATPPLEALRMIISDAATLTANGGRKVVMVNDVARAFFEAPIKRTVCVELPEEAMTEEERAAGVPLVGLLQMSLYGTRDAASNFKAEVSRLMASLGFSRGNYNPCTYWHRQRGLKTMVHGDDFITSGIKEQAAWFDQKLKERFEIKTKVVGADVAGGEVCEARVLNRIIRCGEAGWEYEPDQRHSELMIKELNLQGAKPVRTPGEDDKKGTEVDEDEELDKQEARRYRGIVARGNYLAQDRLDIQFTVKELSRGMAKPTRGDMRKARRLGRYLIGKPRVVTSYLWQGQASKIEA